MIQLQHTDKISIERIAGGIPLIRSNSMSDQYYGLGYCHGIDRGMQLMFMKIIGTGTASQHLAGSDEMLEVDKFFRKMNWSNQVDEELSKLDEEEDQLLQAYCDGVNAAFKKHKPWELKYLLGYKDFQWKKEHCILIFRMSGYLTFAQSQGEIERLFIQMVQKGVSKELLYELFPNILDDYDEPIIRQIKLNEKIVPDAVKWNVGIAPMMASNNWAISGGRTASGKPIFANDPHMEINRLPAIWYEAATQIDDQHTHGVTIPGVPAFIIGRNDSLSWGITYAFGDAVDSWIENCGDGKYLKDGKWKEFTKREETIQRKNGSPATIVFFENEHGVLDGNPSEKGYYLSTNWSGNKSGASTIKSGIKLATARNAVEGMHHAGGIEMSLSWVFADVDGNIGYQMSGLIPKRREGVRGFAPLVGWLSENDWQGYHSSEDLPRSYNPNEGFIITANNDLNYLGKVNPINMPMGAYRAERIRQLIETKKNHDINDSQNLQYDTYSLQAEAFMKIIRPLLPDSEQASILKNWDLKYDADSKGAYLFELVYRGLLHEVFGDILGKILVDFLQNETGIFIDFYENFDRILLVEDSAWFAGRGRKEIYQKVIDVVLENEVKEWGEVNTITLSHILLGGKLPNFMGFDKGPYPLPGGRATIHQGQIYHSVGRKTCFGPSFRFVTDMAEKKLFTNLAGGCSDRRFSSYYNNDFENWRNATYREYTF